MIDARGNVTSKIIDISSQSDYHQDSIKYKENGIYTIQGYNDFSFVPESGVINQCWQIGFMNVMTQIQYTVEFDIIWKNFTDLTSKFTCWLQGSQYNKKTGLWEWTYHQYLTESNGINLREMICAKSSGKTHAKYITVPLGESQYIGFGVGIRIDNSNGIGEVGFHNITVVPTKYKPKNTNITMFDNTIVLDNFMEV